MDNLYGIAIIPLIVGIVEVSKTFLSPKYAGIVSLALGILVGLSYGLLEAHWSLLQSLVIGSALGLSASGFYSTQKNLRE